MWNWHLWYQTKQYRVYHIGNIRNIWHYYMVSHVSSTSKYDTICDIYHIGRSLSSERKTYYITNPYKHPNSQWSIMHD